MPRMVIIRGIYFANSLFIRIFATTSNMIMETLTLQIEDKNLLSSLKKVLKAIPGIKIIQNKNKKKDPTHFTMADLDARIEKAHQDLKEGRVKEFYNPEDMHRWLESL